MNNKKHLLVTGARGLIGSVLIKNLKDKFIISAIDKAEAKDESNYHSLDLSDIGQLKSMLNESVPIDCILHLAADPSPSSPWEDILKNNIIATRNIYECARVFKIKKVIFAGTTHTYGCHNGYPNLTNSNDPITSDSPLRSDSDYGDSKAYGEVLARRYYDQHGIKSIILKIGHVTYDNKPEEPYESLWLSYNDLTQIFNLAIQADIPFGSYFAMSNNKDLMFDIQRTITGLKYYPQG